MKMLKTFILVLSLSLQFTCLWAADEETNRILVMDLARLATVKDNALIGYGIVTGLAGTGDSPRNGATLQSVHNMLLRFGLNVSEEELRARNAAAVMVSATLPPYAQPGDKLFVNVTSLGDARSLFGGTLMMTPLATADREIYAMAQGPLFIGGYSFDLNGNLVQKNHPTSAHIPEGATVDRPVDPIIIDDSGNVFYKLNEPNFGTAKQMVDALNEVLGSGIAEAKDASRIRISVPEANRSDLVSYLTLVEKTEVVPTIPARVVVNERTGTVVSGENVIISPVTITHGDLIVYISTEFFVSQPFGIANTFIASDFSDVRTQVVPQTTIEVTEKSPIAVTLPNGAKVSELVMTLNRVKATSRDIITILQAIKRAGALHAELIIQ